MEKLFHLLLQTAQTEVQTDEGWEANGSGRSICDIYTAVSLEKKGCVTHPTYSVKVQNATEDVNTRTHTLRAKVSSAHTFFQARNK